MTGTNIVLSTIWISYNCLQEIKLKSGVNEKSHVRLVVLTVLSINPLIVDILKQKD